MKNRSRGRAISRNEMLREFDVMKGKEDMYSNARFASVESPMSSFYGGIDPRRRVEMAEAGMVREDHGSIANLSERFVHQEYDANEYTTTPYLDEVVRRR
jgi:hypothetical protein